MFSIYCNLIGAKRLELHGFPYASLGAYGCCIYIRICLLFFFILSGFSLTNIYDSWQLICHIASHIQIKGVSHQTIIHPKAGVRSFVFIRQTHSAGSWGDFAIHWGVINVLLVWVFVSVTLGMVSIQMHLLEE